MRKKSLHRPQTIALLLIIFVAVPFILCGCGDLSYSYVRGTDGSVSYDYTLVLDEGYTDTQLAAIFDAAENTVRALPLYSSDHTQFLRSTDRRTFIYREYYESLQDLYLARGITGYEKPSQDEDTPVEHGVLFDTYTTTTDSIFQTLDDVYANDYYLRVYGKTTDELSDSLRAYYGEGGVLSYSDSGLENIRLLFLTKLADEGMSDTELMAGTLSLRYIYGTKYKNITSNADSVEHNSLLTATDAATADLYFHTWALGDYDDMADKDIVLKQRSPRAARWYVLSIPAALVVGLGVYYALRVFKRKERNSDSISRDTE